MGRAVTTVEASLAVTATLYQAADVARLAVDGAAAADVDQVGAPELRGPSVGRRLYRAKDGWVVVCCVTSSDVARLGAAVGLGTSPVVGADDVAEAVGTMTVEEVLVRLRDSGVPAAASLHHSAVPDDPQVVARGLLRQYRHPAAGRFVQVGIPLSLSVDAPAVKGPGPDAGPVRRRAAGRAARRREDRQRAGGGAAPGGGPGDGGRSGRAGLPLGRRDDERSRSCR